MTVPKEADAIDHVNLRYQKGTSDKFYNVSIYLTKIDAPYILRTHWGKRGTRGQSQVLEFHEYREALRALNKVVKSKKAKGYEVVSNSTTIELEQKKKTPRNRKKTVVSNSTTIELEKKKKTPRNRKKTVKAWAEEQWDIL